MTPVNKKAAVFVAAAILAAGALMAAGLFRSVAAVRNMDIADVDIASVPDGVYKASEEYLGFTCGAEVFVKDGRIADIRLTESRSDEWVEKAKGVGKRVVEAQSLKVDAVTGATITSKAMLKAIEKAIKGQGSGVTGQGRN